MEFEVQDGLVILKSSEGYWSAYEAGQALEERFPGHQAVEFTYCVFYNDLGPLNEDNGIIDFKCVKVGENDGPDWVWALTMEDGSRWLCRGGCDFTGWDCQSSNSWNEDAVTRSVTLNQDTLTTFLIDYGVADENSCYHCGSYAASLATFLLEHFELEWK